MNLKLSKFLGKQLGRLRMGHLYIALVLQMFTALSLVKLAFNIPLNVFIITFFLGLFGIWFLGYFLDTQKIKTADDGKLLEQTLPHWRLMIKGLLLEVDQEIKKRDKLN